MQLRTLSAYSATSCSNPVVSKTGTLIDTSSQFHKGRPYGFTDETLANEVMAAAKKNEFAVSEFVQSLVLSESFKTK